MNHFIVKFCLLPSTFLLRFPSGQERAVSELEDVSIVFLLKCLSVISNGSPSGSFPPRDICIRVPLYSHFLSSINEGHCCFWNFFTPFPCLVSIFQPHFPGSFHRRCLQGSGHSLVYFRILRQSVTGTDHSSPLLINFLRILRVGVHE